MQTTPKLNMKNIITLSISLMIGLTALAQDNTTVDLSWKIKTGDTLIYETIMEEIDTSKVEFEIQFEELFKAFSSIIDEDIEDDKSKVFGKETENMFKQLSDANKNTKLQTELTNSGKQFIDIVMKSIPMDTEESIDADTTLNEMAEIMKNMRAMNNGIVLRGSVFETGGIHSFWTKGAQKNLIALLYQLPSQPVKVGDSWSLDLSLLSFDQNFECDTANKVNKVTLIELIESEGQTIAVLQYDISEFAKGIFNAPAMFGQGGSSDMTMNYSHQAIGKFSIDKGRWISYDGITEIHSKGWMSSNSKKRFSLIEK